MPEPATESGKYGDTRILLAGLDDSFRELDDAGNVKAKVWESEAGERRLFLRIRDHDDGRRFNEFSVDVEREPTKCVECATVLDDPKNRGDPDVNGEWVCSDPLCRSNHDAEMACNGGAAPDV